MQLPLRLGDLLLLDACHPPQLVQLIPLGILFGARLRVQNEGNGDSCKILSFHPSTSNETRVGGGGQLLYSCVQQLHNFRHPKRCAAVAGLMTPPTWMQPCHFMDTTNQNRSGPWRCLPPFTSSDHSRLQRQQCRRRPRSLRAVSSAVPGGLLAGRRIGPP